MSQLTASDQSVPRPFIRYAHTPSMVAVNGLTGPSCTLLQRPASAEITSAEMTSAGVPAGSMVAPAAVSGVRLVTVPLTSAAAGTASDPVTGTVTAGPAAAADPGRPGEEARRRRTTGRAHRRWRRLGAAAMLAATLATGTALPAQASAADAATRAAGTTHQPATLTAPVGVTASSTSLPPRKGRG